MKNAVVHCKRDSYDVYIGRPGEWGNPFSHKQGTRAEYVVSSVAEAIESYRRWLFDRIEREPELKAKIAALHGQTLGCWCKPGPCHGDVLVSAAKWAALTPACDQSKYALDPVQPCGVDPFTESFDGTREDTR